MRVLVTGATGFVGQALGQALVARGDRVVRAVRGARGLAGEVVVGDIGPDTDWTPALSPGRPPRLRLSPRGGGEKVDAVVHLAARVHVMRDSSADPLAAFRAVNTAGTLNLARQASDAGVRRFVYLSSVKVNGEGRDRPYTEADPAAPEDAYAISKWEAEQGLRVIERDTGMQVAILRPPLVYGPGVKANFASLMTRVARGWPLPLGAVNNRRSLLHLGNLVSAIEACLDHPAAAGRTFLVSDGEDVSTPELIRRIARVMDKPARLIPVSPAVLRALAGLLGKSAQADRLLGSLAVDSSALRDALGWRPPFTLDQGLSETVRRV